MIQRDRRIRGCNVPDVAPMTKAEIVAQKRKAKDERDYMASLPKSISGMDIDQVSGEVNWNGNYLFTVRVGMSVAGIKEEIQEVMSYI